MAWADWVNAACGLKMLLFQGKSVCSKLLDDSHCTVGSSAVELICHSDDRLGPCFSNLRAIGLLHQRLCPQRR